MRIPQALGLENVDAQQRSLVGVGLAIAAAALLPLSHALTRSIRPYVPPGPLGTILGVSALPAFVALALPTGRALRTPPVSALGVRE